MQILLSSILSFIEIFWSKLLYAIFFFALASPDKKVNASNGMGVRLWGGHCVPLLNGGQMFSEGIKHVLTLCFIVQLKKDLHLTWIKFDLANI